MNAQLRRLLTLTLCVVGFAKAVPTAEEYPEVIPGPGLPSLASLNITSAELYRTVPTQGKNSLFLTLHQFSYATNFLDIKKSLARRFPLLCNEVPQCSIADATACFNFLNALGHQACTVPGPVGGSSTFCTAGGCHWFGGNIKQGGGPVSSFWCVSTLQHLKISSLT
jgi:hypothetical protein